MRKSLRSILELALAFLLVFTLLGCAPASAPETPKPDEGEKKEPIKIGVIQPLTGPVAFDGQLVVAGARMAEEEINKRGGVLGRELKLVIEDGKNDPAESVNAAEKLITRDNVTALMGAWGSSSTLAVMPIVERYGVPMIVETSTSPKITSPEAGNEWTFRISSTNQIDALHLEPYFQELGFTRAAFLPVNNDWGRSVAEAYAAALERQGGKTVVVEYHAPGDTDFYPQLTSIRNTDANVLIITTDFQNIKIICEQAYELGLDINKLATSGFSAALLLDIAEDPSTLEGLYLVDYFVPYSPPTEIKAQIEDFVMKYQEKYPGKGLPDKYVASGYDGIMVLADAIERAGSTDPEGVKEALAATEYRGLTGFLKFDEFNQAYPNVYLVQIKAGEPVVLKTFTKEY